MKQMGRGITGPPLQTAYLVQAQDHRHFAFKRAALRGIQRPLFAGFNSLSKRSSAAREPSGSFHRLKSPMCLSRIDSTHGCGDFRIASSKRMGTSTSFFSLPSRRRASFTANSTLSLLTDWSVSTKKNLSHLRIPRNLKSSPDSCICFTPGKNRAAPQLLYGELGGWRATRADGSCRLGANCAAFTPFQRSSPSLAGPPEYDCPCASHRQQEG